MRVYGLNATQDVICEYDYLQLLWHRRFYAPGEFTLYMPATQNVKGVELIKVEGRSDTAYLYKTTFSTDIRGAHTTLEGKFIEDLTNDIGTQMGDELNAATSLNAQLLELLKGYVAGETESGNTTLSPRAATVGKHKKVGEEMYRILKAEKESFALVLTGNDVRIRYLKAPDKTGTVIFNQHIGNLEKADFHEDFSGYYHRCYGYIEIPKDIKDTGYIGLHYIGGKYYERADYTSTLSVPKRLQGRVMSRDYSMPEGMECSPANKPRIQAAIKDLCKLELLNHYVDRDIDVQPIQVDGCKYLEDYDLGDLVTIQIPDIELTYEAQIIEVIERWEKNHQKIELKLGNKKVKR